MRQEDLLLPQKKQFSKNVTFYTFLHKTRVASDFLTFFLHMRFHSFYNELL